MTKAELEAMKAKADTLRKVCSQLAAGLRAALDSVRDWLADGDTWHVVTLLAAVQIVTAAVWRLIGGRR